MLKRDWWDGLMEIMLELLSEIKMSPANRLLAEIFFNFEKSLSNIIAGVSKFEVKLPKKLACVWQVPKHPKCSDKLLINSWFEYIPVNHMSMSHVDHYSGHTWPMYFADGMWNSSSIKYRSKAGTLPYLAPIEINAWAKARNLSPYTNSNDLMPLTTYESTFLQYFTFNLQRH